MPGDNMTPPPAPGGDMGGMMPPPGGDETMPPPTDGGFGDEGMGDEDEMDPKKDIQKQTGALSQALDQYNQEQEKPDTELNKYVMNMIGKQAGKALTPKDKKEVMKKMNTPGGADDNETAEDMEAETEMDMQDGGDDAGENKTFESRMKRYGRIIDEVLNNELSKDRDSGRGTKRKKKNISNPKVTYNNPFVCS